MCFIKLYMWYCVSVEIYYDKYSNGWGDDYCSKFWVFYK